MSVFLSLLAAAAVRIDAPATISESRIAMASYAACVLARKPAAVEALLARPYDDRVSKASRDLYEPSCPLASGTTVFRTEILRRYEGLGWRAALYEALARRDRSRLATITTLAFPGEAAFPSGRMWPGSPAANYLQYIGMGECVVKRDPGNARALVLSDIESADERAITEAILPAFRKCGFTRNLLTLARGVLSEIYFRAAIPAVERPDA